VLAVILFMLFACLAFVYMADAGEDIFMNYFEDYAESASRSSRIMFDISRISVAIMLLLTFPVESIATASIIKRIQRRYLRNQLQLKLSLTASERPTTTTSYSYSVVSTADSAGYLLGSDQDAAATGSNNSFSRASMPPHTTFPGGRLSPNCPDGYNPEQWAAVLQKDLASNASSVPTPRTDRDSNKSSHNNNVSFDVPGRLSNLSYASDTTVPVHDMAWSTESYVARRLQQQQQQQQQQAFYEGGGGAGGMYGAGRLGVGMSVDSTMRGMVDDSTVDPLEEDFEDDESENQVPQNLQKLKCKYLCIFNTLQYVVDFSLL
jgi:hypothetical protein